MSDLERKPMSAGPDRQLRFLKTYCFQDSHRRAVGHYPAQFEGMHPCLENGSLIFVILVPRGISRSAPRSWRLLLVLERFQIDSQLLKGPVKILYQPYWLGKAW